MFSSRSDVSNPAGVTSNESVVKPKIIAHGNPIFDLVKASGITTSIIIPEDNYSEIFIVSPDGPSQLLRLHYPF
jgi:hypothetical protein